MLNLKKELRQAKKMKKWCKKNFPDWEDNEFNCGPNKFIWGVKSEDETSSAPTSFCTLNDLYIYYNRQSGLYFLNIEALYYFEADSSLPDKHLRYIPDKTAEASYIKSLLTKFTAWIKEQGYTLVDVPLYELPSLNMEAETIGQLYGKFKIIANGFYETYRSKEKKNG